MSAVTYYSDVRSTHVPHLYEGRNPASRTVVATWKEGMRSVRELAPVVPVADALDVTALDERSEAIVPNRLERRELTEGAAIEDSYRLFLYAPRADPADSKVWHETLGFDYRRIGTDQCRSRGERAEQVVERHQVKAAARKGLAALLQAIRMESGEIARPVGMQRRMTAWTLGTLAMRDYFYRVRQTTDHEHERLARVGILRSGRRYAAPRAAAVMVKDGRPIYVIGRRTVRMNVLRVESARTLYYADSEANRMARRTATAIAKRDGECEWVAVDGTQHVAHAAS